MTKRQAIKLFQQYLRAREFYRPIIGPRDKCAEREAWNNYTDALCKNGIITARQYDTWVYIID